LTDPFSPNSTSSIGVKDTSTANIAVVRDDFNWEVLISQGGPTIKSFTGSSTDGTVDFNWDGKDTTGNFVDDGTYSLDVTVTDIVGHEKTATASILVDNFAPTVTVTLTATGTVEKNTGFGDLSGLWASVDNHDSSFTFDGYIADLGLAVPDSISDLVLWFDAFDPSGDNRYFPIEIISNNRYIGCTSIFHTNRRCAIWRKWIRQKGD